MRSHLQEAPGTARVTVAESGMLGPGAGGGDGASVLHPAEVSADLRDTNKSGAY